MSVIPNIYQVTGKRVRGGFKSKLSKYTFDQDYLAHQLGSLRKGKFIGYDNPVKTDFFSKAKPEVQALYTQKAIDTMTYNAGRLDARRDLRNFTKDCMQKGIVRTLRDFYHIPENLSERKAIKKLMKKMLTKTK